MIEQLKQTYKKRFKTEPIVISSPGRINLIGEHTDYNDGFVLPAAVDKKIYFAIGTSDSNECSAISLDMQEEAHFNIADDLKPTKQLWLNYIYGVIEGIKKENKTIKGFNCIFGGDIPIGSGMSSSAALEGGIGTGLNHLYNLNLDKNTLAKIGQWAEHNYVGVKCGIMDQFANIFGATDKVIKLDCRDLSYSLHNAIFDDLTIILFDTHVKHSLGDSEYNKRRSECEAGVEIISKYNEGIQSLRDVTKEMLEAHKSELGDVVYRRCTYVVSENERVQQMCDALDQNNFKLAGELMYATHEGLSKNYEVSCEELDFLVDESKKHDQILGSRMMGGGFGGCTINLVKKGDETSLIEEMKKAYKKAFDIDMPVYQINISQGTSVIE